MRTLAHCWNGCARAPRVSRIARSDTPVHLRPLASFPPGLPCTLGCPRRSRSTFAVAAHCACGQPRSRNSTHAPAIGGEAVCTKPVVQAQPAPPGLSLGQLEPLLRPDALHPLVFHLPPFPLQQGGDPSIAVPAVFRRQANDALGQPLFRFGELRSSALARAGLTERPAYPCGAHAHGAPKRRRSAASATPPAVVRGPRSVRACRASQPALGAVQGFPRPSPAAWRCPRQGPQPTSSAGCSPARGP